MREGAVGFGHPVRVFALLDGVATVVGGVHQFTRKARSHRVLAAIARRCDQPADRERLRTLGAHFDGHLIGRTTNAAAAHFDAVAEGIVYTAMETVETRAKRDPIGVFHDALNNVKPGIEVRSRRVGGATYQVPVEVRTERSQALAIRWLITAARNRSEHTMAARLSGELMDAANNRGNAVKKREDTHRMAEANRAFSHYRW